MLTIYNVKLMVFLMSSLFNIRKSAENSFKSKIFIYFLLNNQK